MKRNNCETSRLLDTNWGRKIKSELHNDSEYESTECFYDNRNKVVRFFDKQMANEKEVIAYSCSTISK